jgi:hypothetical protein
MLHTRSQTGDISVDFTLIGTAASSLWLYAAAGLLCLSLGFWITYRVIKAAVRDGIKEAGLYSNRAMAQGSRKGLDPKYDFVYTEPRPE